MLRHQINLRVTHHPGYLVLGVLFLLLSGCSGTAPVKEDTAAPAVSNNPALNKEFERAVSVMRSGDRKRAFRLFTDITKKYPGYAGAHVNIGLAWLNARKYEKAHDSFKKALAINTKNAVAYNGLGVVYRQQGKFKEAEDAYLQALSIDSNYAIAHLNIGILNDIYFDQPAKALTHYQEYTKNTQNADKRVAKWIIDVQRRSKTSPTSTKISRGGKK